MSRFGASDHLKELYETTTTGPSEWCRVCAEDKAANVIALCEARPHRTVLEIGAGEGAVLRRLSEKGFGESLYALEIADNAVAAIRQQRIPRLDGCARFDGDRIPLESDSFDLAILSHVIEHVEYPRRLLYEAARVARAVFVEVPLEDNLRLPRDFVLDPTGHINVYSPVTIRRLVQSCGLGVERQIVTNPSRQSYRFHGGRLGAVKHGIKQAVLTVWPAVATRLFTYHSALLATRKETPRGPARPGGAV